MGQFIEGIRAYFWALGQISKGKLLYNILITGVISLLLGSLLFLFAYSISDNLGGWLIAFYPWEFGKSVLSKILNVASGATIGIIGILLYKYVIIIIVSPFMSPLSEKIEHDLIDDAARPTEQRSASYNLIRGIRLSIRNIWKEITITLFLLGLSLIPGFAIFTGPLIFLVQAYYAGFGNMDYTMERHMDVKQAKQFVRKYKISATVNGAVFLAILFIPILGLFLAPSLATAAATKVTTARLNALKA